MNKDEQYEIADKILLDLLSKTDNDRKETSKILSKAYTANRKAQQNK